MPEVNDPIRRFSLWFRAAAKRSPGPWFDPTAMTLATTGKRGDVTARIVLLKKFGPEGFTFYTNYASRKGRQLGDNPRAALVFYWPHLHRQVRIEGRIEKVSRDESDAYFHSRPRPSQIGAAASLGIRLKTVGELTNLREISVNSLPSHSDELLAFTADQRNWRLTLAPERLVARIVADVFDLITIGDGLVGGSATIRYGLVNQGVQEFKVRLPAHWKNVEFTGPNIRRWLSSGELLAHADHAKPAYPMDSS